MKKLLALSATVAATSGCGTVPGLSSEPLDMPPFEMDVHQKYVAPPAVGAITGQAFLRQQGGGVVTCAGGAVIALPSTYYFRFLLDHSKRIAAQGLQVASTANELTRRTTCDAQGSYAFANLPAGEWIVVTEVQWTVGYAKHGGILRGTAEVPANGSTQLILSNSHL